MIYLNKFCQTLFILLLAGSSVIGVRDHASVFGFTDLTWVSVFLTVAWAMLLLSIYSYFEGKKAIEHDKIKQYAENARMIRADDTKIPPKKFDKIEIQHTVDPSTDPDKVPGWIKKDTVK